MLQPASDFGPARRAEIGKRPAGLSAGVPAVSARPVGSRNERPFRPRGQAAACNSRAWGMSRVSDCAQNAELGAEPEERLVVVVEGWVECGTRMADWTTKQRRQKA